MGYVLSDKDLFSNVECDLGEGCIWHEKRESFLWLDINKKVLYEKKSTSGSKTYDSKWHLDEIGSALAVNDFDVGSIYIITDKSFGLLSLGDGEYEQIVTLGLKDSMRSNDGGVGPDGYFWFGTMEKSPKKQSGKVYKISPQLELTSELDSVGIPNTFCWDLSQSRFLLSDSLLNKTYEYEISKNSSLDKDRRRVFTTSESNCITPDGGAIDETGNYWIAQWGGGVVNRYSAEGEVIEAIRVPAPQVTNCCFGGADGNNLIITTAKENLSKEELEKYPLSGCTFIVKLPTKGALCPSFRKEERRSVS